MLFWTHIYYVHNVLQDIVVVILCTSIFILLHQQLTFDITPKKMTIKGLSTIFHLYFFKYSAIPPQFQLIFVGLIWNSSKSQTTLKKRRYSTKFLLLYVLLHKTLYCVFGAFGFCLYKAWNQFTYFIYVS